MWLAGHVARMGEWRGKRGTPWGGELLSAGEGLCRVILLSWSVLSSDSFLALVV